MICFKIKKTILYKSEKMRMREYLLKEYQNMKPDH